MLFCLLYWIFILLLLLNGVLLWNKHKQTRKIWAKPWENYQNNRLFINIGSNVWFFEENSLLSMFLFYISIAMHKCTWRYFSFFVIVFVFSFAKSIKYWIASFCYSSTFKRLFTTVLIERKKEIWQNLCEFFV